MTVHFVDSSVVACAYLPDEPKAEEARALLLGDEAVVASELVRVEVTRALVAAGRYGRLRATLVQRLLGQLDSDLGAGRAVELIAFDGPPTLARARELVLEHPIRTLDALHLAVADREGRLLAEPAEELRFVTRDQAQLTVARALRLAP